MSVFQVRNSCDDFNTYRAARVKSLFNAESGANFSIDVEADIDPNGPWTIGVIVGPSGSGKTSLGKLVFPEGRITSLYDNWPPGTPIVDAIAPDGAFDAVTAALAAVGLGDVPAWLRPFSALSNGQQFRAGLARMVVEKPARAVVDEYSSVVDRQVAQIGSKALQKSWRRGNTGGNKLILLTPHYDVLDWLQPDWVIDLKDRQFHGRWLRPVPRITLDIIQTDSRPWALFKPHYYLDLPMPVAASYFVALADGEPACHLAVCPRFNGHSYRMTRLVTMPEWQGAGVGSRFLDWVAQYHLDGHGLHGKRYPSLFHTSHPQLIQSLRRSPLWVQKSAALYGGSKEKSRRSLERANAISKAGYGGHLRAIQGFKYVGGDGAPKVEVTA